MTPIGWFAIITSVLVGAILGFYIYKKFPNLFNRDDKKIKEVISNPHLLIEKLKAHGEIYDSGKKLDIKVGIDEKTGKEVLIIEKKEWKKEKKIKVPEKLEIKNKEGKKIILKKKKIKKKVKSKTKGR